MLIHQIPPKPNYLRVKVGRRLARIGAVALKNTVYVLPRSDSAQEDFQWVLREVVAAGGEATLLDAHLVDGLADPEVEALFRDARDDDYVVIAGEARDLAKRLQGATADDELRRQLEPDLRRLERRVEEIAAIDFFGASGRETAHGLLAALRARLAPPAAPPPAPEPDERDAYHGRTWVTRVGIHIDRIASAWLIRRFIDPDARLKFVQARGYAPAPGELRFDMFEAEFSHEGDLCTFEVLCARFQLEQPGLRALAELVHDIDLKDGKFGRPEVAGLAAQIAGLGLLHRDDETRLARGSELLDELCTYFAKKRRPEEAP
ncbi:MAG: chromate resistance protein [Deltaproteobacteria bacterium]|nr:chromate resistance protein [Deltaproteobacteria bacterium]